MLGLVTHRSLGRRALSPHSTTHKRTLSWGSHSDWSVSHSAVHDRYTGIHANQIPIQNFKKNGEHPVQFRPVPYTFCTAHIFSCSPIVGWALPHQSLMTLPHQSLMMTMTNRHVYRAIWWRQLLTWDSLFPGETILYQVDKLTSTTSPFPPTTSHTWLIPYPAGPGRHWWLGGSFGESSTPWVRVVLSEGLCHFGQTLGLGFSRWISHCLTLWTLHCPQLHRAGNGKSPHLTSYSIRGQKHQCSTPISFCKWRSGPSPVRPPTPQDPRKLLLPSQLARWEMGWLPETQASSHAPPISVLASH